MGRGGELSLLMQYRERAREGEGQVVLLEGEPGMGKSRLIEAARDTIGAEALTVQRYQCSPNYIATAFHPVVNLLERTAGFVRGDDTDTKLDKLELSMETSAQSNESTVTLMARLLSVPTERCAPLNMTPQRQRVEQIVMLVRQLEDYCAVGPMLMLVEDMHWSDPSTIEVLDTMIDRIQGLPVLALISYGREFRPPWTVYGHVTSHLINRLGRKDVKAIVKNVAESGLLPQHVLKEIIIKTDGVPLFAEELTKAVLETQSLSAAGQSNAMDAPILIPSTLRDALLPRLDLLEAAREVAQMGACIGRVFGHELVAAISSLHTSVLDEALSELVIRGLVFQQGESTEATYTSKQALVRDVAYSSLLRSKRRQLHAQIVEILKVRSETSANVEPELLAQNCERAGMSEQAIHYYRLAGENSNERSSYQEALQFFERGLKLAQSQSQAPSDALQRELLDMRLAMRAGFGAVSRYEVYSV
jgi:predicted ATPase